MHCKKVQAKKFWAFDPGGAGSSVECTCEGEQAVRVSGGHRPPAPEGQSAFQRSGVVEF